MADDQRTASYDVILCDALKRAPREFDFFTAMRMLERAHSDRPRWGEARRPADEPVRLGQDVSLAFAPTALVSFASDESQRPPRLAVSFFGAFGPNGALPLHLTEHTRHRLHHHADTTFARFVDLFHHRLLSLFYRAWASSRPTVQRDRPEADRFQVYMGALSGRGLRTTRERDALSDLAKLYYTGLLSAPTRNAAGLSAMVSDFFGVPARVEEFVGEWIDLPPGSAWSLGGVPRRSAPRMGLLGRSALLGSRVFSVQHKFRLTLGPLTRAMFRRLAPGGESLPRLVAMVRNYIGDELAWDVRLMPEEKAVQPLQLGTSRLGWDTWLVSEPGRPTRWEDLIFDPQEAGQAAGDQQPAVGAGASADG